MDDQFIRKRRKKNSADGFITPDQTASKDEHSVASPIINHQEEKITTPITRSSIEKKKFRLPKMNSKLVLLIVCLVIVLAGLGLLAYKQFHKNSINLQASKINAATKQAPKTVASNLSGLQVDPSLNKLPVTAVMIENSIDARPQSGLSQAMVVFEAVAEGGVTRFMALYQDTSPSSIGPIRSARPYYVSWALGFDAPYAHVGGSPDALADITSWGVKDLNQFYNGSYYQRITSRAAPHNVYSSVSELNQLEFKKGYNSSTFTTWTRKPEAALKTPTATKISMSLSGYYYDPSYVYYPKTNSYDRSEAGAAQTDANNSAQISPKVVIAIVTPETQGALDATGAYYSDYNVLGTNAAYVFQDGGVTIGNWTKSTNNSQILFTTSAGKPLPLDPGQVWITAITDSSKVTYS